jgi:hypothetical protein
MAASSALGRTAFCSPCAGFDPARASWRVPDFAVDFPVEAFFDVAIMVPLLVNRSDVPCP